MKIRLSQTISSSDAKVNQEVPFEVMEELKVDDTVVLAKGATAIGTVTEAEPKRRMGRGGKLNVTINYARLTDQEKVTLRAVKEGKGGGHVGAMTGAMVATGIVFFPAAPLFLFMHGKDITIPQGTEINAFVDGDLHLKMANFGGEASPRDSSRASDSAGALVSGNELTTLSVESTPAGADIEVDGTFVGNTPSTINAKAGTHQITVVKSGFKSWSKTLTVTGGIVHLNAELEAAPAQSQ